MISVSDIMDRSKMALLVLRVRAYLDDIQDSTIRDLPYPE